ncbi:MAG: hypothetical protein KZQ99_22505 [Candidatus Thiodiazotropha sp. (ex Dulcina madagascariensis)]|nr:hypothetical protein [Candidatus Thiodiazotropha sp. (ex Dulcina madagascariensis)]
MANRDIVKERMSMPIFWIGLFLIIAGAGTLLYLAYISVQIIQAPAEVELVKWLISGTEKSGLIVSGVIINPATK